MMYHIFTLKFLTPVRFGLAQSGGKLEKAAYSCPADTFFSALCVEAAMQNTELLHKFIDGVKRGSIVLSSLFPYYQRNANRELELYLPKPLRTAKPEAAAVMGLQEMKGQATRRKQMKKTLFVRASEIRALVRSAAADLTQRDFAVPALNAKVNERGALPQPYYVSSYSFTKEAGLYFIAGADDEADMDMLLSLTGLLGYTGIGGKRSSGCGKFVMQDDPFELDAEAEVCGKDDHALAGMLEDSASSCQMCIAPLCPQAEEAEIAAAGSYKLLQRSGFVDSRPAGNIKRPNVYMLAEGSCFDRRLQGSMAELPVKGVEHKVYRNGLGMFVGL